VPTALIVGGTGPTGPHILAGLTERGYTVKILHRGLHEPPGLAHIEHIHADPFEQESIDGATHAMSFDLVVAMYGRTRLVAESFAGRCRRFVGVGGAPVYLGFLAPETVRPYGVQVPVSEDAPLAGHESLEWTRSMTELEARVFELHSDGAFSATWFRYPWVYGPRNPYPLEWSVIKRVQDGRHHILLPEAGLTLITRGAARNVAHALLLGVDNPDAAGGQVFNCGDDRQLSFRQWVETLAELSGGWLDIVSVPWELASPSYAFLPRTSAHGLLSTTKIKQMLGYSDIVNVRDAMKESVEWYLENPPTKDTRDSFDYELEDRLTLAYRAAVESVLQSLPSIPPTRDGHVKKSRSN
jgi:nucleoside-diphosphate-sugar epimerase